MAWQAVTDVNDGQSLDGAAWESAKDAIEQVQATLGASEGLVPYRLAVASVSGTSFTLMSSIPTGFSALKIEGVARHNGNTNTHRVVSVRFNNDSTGPYQHSRWSFDGTASNASPSATSSATVLTFAEIGDDMSTFSLTIPRYSVVESQYVSGEFASAISGAAATAGNWHRGLSQGRWSASAAISRIDVLLDGTGGDSFAAGNAILYGLP